MSVPVWSSTDHRLLPRCPATSGARVPRRTFDVIDIVEILIHWYAGRSQHELAASLGVDRKTLRK